MLVGNSVFGARNAAHQEDDQIEHQAESRDRVGEGHLARRKAAIEQVHADMRVQLKRIAAAEQVVGDEQELPHLHRPVDWHIVEGPGRRRVEQDAHHHEDQVCNGPANDAVDGLDISHVDPGRLRHENPHLIPYRDCCMNSASP